MSEVTTEQRQQKTKRKGKSVFSLVNLLLVIVVIGILSATSLTNCGAYRRRAYVAHTKANLKNAAAAQQSYFAKNSFYKSCASCTSSDLSGYDKSSRVTLRAETGTTGFVLTASHKYCKGEWTYQSTTGEITGPSHGNFCEERFY